MGGRGASSGISRDGKVYGTEYHSVLKADNIKFIVQNEATSIKTPMETMTKNRIYVTLGESGDPKAITFYDDEGKRTKQIDITGSPHKINGKPTIPHTHHGYFHVENGGTTELSGDEKKLVEHVLDVWYRYKRRE